MLVSCMLLNGRFPIGLEKLTHTHHWLPPADPLQLFHIYMFHFSCVRAHARARTLPLMLMGGREGNRKNKRADNKECVSAADNWWSYSSVKRGVRWDTHPPAPALSYSGRTPGNITSSRTPTGGWTVRNGGAAARFSTEQLDVLKLECVPPPDGSQLWSYWFCYFPICFPFHLKSPLILVYFDYIKYLKLINWWHKRCSLIKLCWVSVFAVADTEQTN